VAGRPRQRVVVTLEALPSQVPVANRLRLFLKVALRAWRLRAVSVEPAGEHGQAEGAGPGDTNRT
jgi:hypothetical protein